MHLIRRVNMSACNSYWWLLDSNCVMVCHFLVVLWRNTRTNRRRALASNYCAFMDYVLIFTWYIFMYYKTREINLQNIYCFYSYVLIWNLLTKRFKNVAVKCVGNIDCFLCARYYTAIRWDIISNLTVTGRI